MITDPEQIDRIQAAFRAKYGTWDRMLLGIPFREPPDLYLRLRPQASSTASGAISNPRPQ